jgi:NAD dependent epimerase/dehydratase family enzyme
LLARRRAVPAKLTEAGFRFRHTTLDEALRDLTA